VGCWPRPALQASAAPNRAETTPSTLAVDFSQLEGFCRDVAPVHPLEFEERRARARVELQRQGASLLVCEAGLNFKFFTGTRWGISERPVLYGLAVDGRDILVVPAFERATFLERHHGLAELSTWQEHENWAEVFARIAKRMFGSTVRVALDPNLRHFVADRIGEQLSSHSGVAIVDGVRQIKTRSEMARLRRANEATKTALSAAVRHLRVGMGQEEIASLVRRAQENAGLTDIWVLALVGPNAAFPHGTNRERKITEGDLVLIDTGGDLHGYQSDISRTYCAGPVDAEREDAYKSVLAAQMTAIAAIGPGMRCGDIDQIARIELAKRGWGNRYQRMTHRLGHGIGIQGHEGPYLVPENRLVLEPGMTMSVEPGIYVPDRYGIRIEDIIAVTQDGCEVFGPRASALRAIGLGD
jgi:Xaa-Pro dipeptidase